MTESKQPDSRESPLGDGGAVNGTDGDGNGDRKDLKNILSWVFGCLFALGALLTPFLGVAVIWLAMAAVLIPPVAAKIGEWRGQPLSASLRRGVVIGGLVLTIVIGACLPDEPDQSHWDKWIGRVGDIGAGF